MDPVTTQVSDSNPKPARKRHPSLSVLMKQSELHFLKISIFLTYASLGLILWLFFNEHYKEKPKYYEILEGSELHRMTPLLQPNLSTESVLKWAMEAATASFRFNFYDYPTAIKNLHPYFTKDGYDNFITDLSKRTLPTIRQKKLVLTSVVTDTPVILREGRIVNGNYAWEIQFPMLLTYESQSDLIYQRVVVTLFVTQVPTTESARGIGIASFITRETS